MFRPGGDDREDVDRAFADLVAQYHLTADRPDPLLEQRAVRDGGGEPTAPSSGAPEAAWADEHPLFRYEEPPEVAAPTPAEESFVPAPLLPMPRPAWPVLVAWLAMGYAVLAALAAAMGLDLPRWAGWLALVGFVGGFGLLVTRLPRHRPPDAGDGAVL